METYLTLLYVTLEQELALKEFFIDKGWMYCKPDLSVTTDRVGPAENPESNKTSGKIITYSEISSNNGSKKTKTVVRGEDAGQKKGRLTTFVDATDIKIEVLRDEELTNELHGIETDIINEQIENDDGDNDDDFADDFTINDTGNDTETTGSQRVAKNRNVGKRKKATKLKNGTSSIDLELEEYSASGQKKRKAAAAAEEKIETVMTDELEENKNTNSLYDKQLFRCILSEALKSSPSGRETAKDEFSICPQCEKSVRNTNIRRHLLSHLDLPYKCSRCTMFFKTHAALEKHRQEKHIGEFICSYCGVEYRFKNSLAEHIQNRHEGTGKLYECPVCGVKMCRKSHLEDHMNVHNNVNPYSCENCSKSYKNKSAYRRHLKDCGSGNKYICDECGQVYKSSIGLNDHLKRCHDKTNRYLLYCVCNESFRTRASRCRHRLHCESFQKQKEDESNSSDRNITILRVTNTKTVGHESGTKITSDGIINSKDNGRLVSEDLHAIVEESDNGETSAFIEEGEIPVDST